MKIYSSFQDTENLYLELEYIQGCTLLSQIRINNPIVKSNLSMIFYTSEIIQTLEYLHKQNIVYRDLKPENILLSMNDNGHIKFVDFGFAKSLKGRTKTNCGTPVYLAPEILRGTGHSFEVDIWSLGVLMVEIVSGQTPFHAEDTQKIYDNITKIQPTYNRFVTPAMRELLSKIFVPEPENRVTLDELKQHRLFKVSKTLLNLIYF